MMETTDLIKSMLISYKKAALQANSAFQANLILILASVAAYFALIFAANLLSPAGFVGGFVLGFVHIILLTLYYSWLSAISDRDKLNKDSLLSFDSALFSNIISVAFVLFLLDYFIRPLKTQADVSWFYYCVQLGLFILLNAICEVLYISRLERFDAINRAYTFVRDNWIEWFIPLIIIFIPWLIINPEGILYALASSDPLLPVLSVVSLSNDYLRIKFGLPIVLTTFIAVSIGSWFMIFRGFLYKDLEKSTRRKRIYAAKN